MARYAVIENGRVKNVTEADEEFAAAQGWVQSDAASIGDLYDEESGAFTTPPPPPPPVPEEVTRQKALKALFLAGVTEAMIDAEIAKLPTPQKELAQIEFKESQTFQRQRPLVIQIGAAMGLDLDALFRTADALP